MLNKIRLVARKIFGAVPGVKLLMGKLVDNLPRSFRWKLAQNAEMQFHREDELRKTEAFTKHSEKIMSGFGYTKDQFANKTVIDVGAGSKLVSLYFERAKIIAIEPLADQFRKELPWNDLYKAEKVYSLPAEEFIPELENRGDFIMCINVLDHTRHPERIMENCLKYLKPDGVMILSVDMHIDFAGLEHPVHFANREEIRNFCKRIGFKIKKEFDGLSELGVAAYGDGEIFSIELVK